eukprot:1102052-Alexandrium_andersonii.AAC.1
MLRFPHGALRITAACSLVQGGTRLGRFGLRRRRFGSVPVVVCNGSSLIISCPVTSVRLSPRSCSWPSKLSWGARGKPGYSEGTQPPSCPSVLGA